MANWEEQLLADNQQQAYTDPTPIYTEIRQEQREKFWARLGFKPAEEQS